MGKGGTSTADSHLAERSANENHPVDSNMQKATVHLHDPDTYKRREVFLVSKKADGKELYDQVIAYLNLAEKEYFALCFTDRDGNLNWIYEDKRISKQAKGHPWEFSLDVKFYPPEPLTVTDDKSRDYLALQVRSDIATGRLPATLPTYAMLGAYVAQEELGNWRQGSDYDCFLEEGQFAPVPCAALFEKINEFHKQIRRVTPYEAQAEYLEVAKKLSMYGIFPYPAKDSKGVPIQIGVGAHGINIYCDRTRVHRFIWQNIIKIAYRRNTFMIKLQPTGNEKSPSMFVLKVPDYASAKRVWKCAVEHHTFFRLIQPDEKPHRGLFGWGSGRFRYQGRTLFQSKMASQMFFHSRGTANRPHSQHITSESQENVAPEALKQPTSPLHYADDGSHELLSTPERSHMLHTMGVTGKSDRSQLVTSTGHGEPETIAKTTSKKKATKTAATPSVGDGATDTESELKREHEMTACVLDKESFALAQHQHLLAPSKEVSFLDIHSWTDMQKPVENGAHAGIITNGIHKHTEGVPETKDGNKDSDEFKGRVVLEKRVDTTYRLGGSGQPPTINPEDAESSLPHTTVESWHESSAGPEAVTTELDEFGNVIKKTVKTQQVKHTIQRQTYQTYSVPEEGEEPDVRTVEASQRLITPIGGEHGEAAIATGTIPVIETRSHTVAYEAGQQPQGLAGPGPQRDDVPGELVSCRTITSGNRTVETITYKTEVDGIIEMHVEHRVTIHSGSTIDHDAELSQAILEATNMNPDMTVEKIEVKQESNC